MICYDIPKCNSFSPGLCVRNAGFARGPQRLNRVDRGQLSEHSEIGVLAALRMSTLLDPSREPKDSLYRVIQGIHWDCNSFYWDDGKENGNYYHVVF